MGTKIGLVIIRMLSASMRQPKMIHVACISNMIIHGLTGTTSALPE